MPDEEEGEKWWLPFCDIDLGYDNWIGWQKDEDRETGNLWHLHKCVVNGKKKWQLGWIDLTSGQKHKLITKDPLHIEASVACPGRCGNHGFIRDGKWQPA